ncbi:MAG: DUF222 domain-containing protein [Acidimicrobiia bacterium]|nr:DUF222 domain-containing protein [Acidimicrobiia bacterium]
MTPGAGASPRLCRPMGVNRPAPTPSRPTTRWGGNPLVGRHADPVGAITTTVDLLGRPVSYTDMNGVTTTTVYDPATGRVPSNSSPAGSTTYDYTRDGRPTMQYVARRCSASTVPCGDAHQPPRQQRRGPVPARLGRLPALGPAERARRHGRRQLDGHHHPGQQRSHELDQLRVRRIRRVRHRHGHPVPHRPSPQRRPRQAAVGRGGHQRRVHLRPPPAAGSPPAATTGPSAPAAAPPAAAPPTPGGTPTAPTRPSPPGVVEGGPTSSSWDQASSNVEKSGPSGPVRGPLSVIPNGDTGGVLEELSAAVDGLLSVDAHGLSDGELSEALVGLEAERARLDAAEARLVAMWDARKAWAVDGARSGAAWLAWRCRLPRAEARRRVRLARWVRDAPVVERAWREGEVSAAHVALLARACTARTAEAFARDEKVLVDAARQLRFGEFAKVVAYWSQHADPDGAEDAAADQVARRQMHLSQSLDGMWLGDLVLDPLGGAAVAETLALIEEELFAADWAEAKTRVGDSVTVADLGRTPPQRRADALVEMAVRARAAPPGGRRPAPLFTVHVGYETFAGRVCELANGAVVAPGALVPWLDGADIERVVFAGPSRVIDVGAHTRFFVGGARRAIEIRDRTCYHPTCDRATRLQVDHVQPWAAGGATTQDNGRLACPHHNRLRNRRAAPTSPDDGEPP